MGKRVPPFIADQYFRRSHGFRSEKRRLIREIKRKVDQLRRGAAYFPDNGCKDVQMIGGLVDRLKDTLSVKVWGK